MLQTARVAAHGLVFFLLLGLGVSSLVIPSVEGQNLNVYEIEGLVQNANGAALQGAAVSLMKKADGSKVADASTDASGTYRFTMLAPGDYVLSGQHSCCQRGSVEATTGGTTVKTVAPSIKLALKEAVQGGDPVKLSGTVKSTKDDAPVARVRLEIQSYWNGDEPCTEAMCKPSGGAQLFTTETDAAGKFELDVNRGSAYVRAMLAGYDTTSGHVDVPADKNVDVPLRPTDARPVRLQGILKGADGAPIANGHVWASIDYACAPEADCVAEPRPAGAEGSGAWTFESAQPQYNSTRSGPDGSWQLQIAPGRLRVVGSAENHLEATKALDGQAGQNATVDLVLERIPPDSVVVAGRVVDRESGKPVARAQVSAENQKWGSWASDEADEDGRFELKTKPGYTVLTARVDAFVACLAAEDASASSIAAPCAPAERSDEYLPAVVSFMADAESSVTKDFKLLPRPAAKSEFKGYVLNASSGQAIPDATVTFYNENTRDWGSATTDADGSYKLTVHAGYYSIRIWAPHHYDGVANAEIGERDVQRLDFELTPGEKRYGYWAYGGYAVMESRTADGAAGGSDEAAAPESPPMPTDGQNVYEGSGGGLGPYESPSDARGASPSPGGLVVLAIALTGLLLWRRR